MKPHLGYTYMGLNVVCFLHSLYLPVERSHQLCVKNRSFDDDNGNVSNFLSIIPRSRISSTSEIRSTESITNATTITTITTTTINVGNKIIISNCKHVEEKCYFLAGTIRLFGPLSTIINKLFRRQRRSLKVNFYFILFFNLLLARWKLCKSHRIILFAVASASKGKKNTILSKQPATIVRYRPEQIPEC